MPTEADDRNRGGSSRRRRLLGSVALISALVVIAFATSLFATLPARVVARYVTTPIEFNAYSGTVWNGTASFEGGHAIQWHIDAWATLLSLRPQLDVSVTGPGTGLSGRLALRSRDDVGLANLGGTLAWPLAASLAPDLEFTCDVTATLTGFALRIAPGFRSGAGTFRAGPGACSETGGQVVPVPDLSGMLATTDDGVHLVVAKTDAPGDPLAEIGLTNADMVVVTVHAAGAALVPDMPASGDTILEYPLPW